MAALPDQRDFFSGEKERTYNNQAENEKGKIIMYEYENRYYIYKCNYSKD